MHVEGIQKLFVINIISLLENIELIESHIEN